MADADFLSINRRPIVPAVVNDVFHARQIDLEWQHRAFEQESSETGLELLRDPSDLNILFTG